jgi:alanine-glyoxylate transaminase/serine-glyoxylate transaminase/serine-pyruvate transaminase
MGYNSRAENVDKLLNLFETELPAFQPSTARPAAAAV